MSLKISRRNDSNVSRFSSIPVASLHPGFRADKYASWATKHNPAHPIQKYTSDLYDLINDIDFINDIDISPVKEQNALEAQELLIYLIFLETSLAEHDKKVALQFLPENNCMLQSYTDYPW